MKRILFIVLIAMGCSEERLEPVVYSDISGKWKFSASSVSGEIEIAKTLDDKMAIVPGTTFKILGVDYTNVHNYALQINGLNISTIELRGKDTHTYLYLYGLQYNSDFTIISSTGFTYFLNLNCSANDPECQWTVEEEIKISRI